MGLLHLVNRQRACRVDLRLLRRALGEPGLLPDEDFDLSIAFVGAGEMARLNQRHVGHSGPTDVITLDHSGGGGELIAEIFICPAVARQQAREFRTAWQSELARYAVHGILHLRGYDDLEAGARRVMKRAENRWLRRLERRFDLRKLGRPLKVRA